MKKLLLTLAVLCGTVSGWAQKLVTSVQEGKYYTLECNSGEAHSTTRFLGENGYGLNGQSAKPTYLIFEATDGGYFVKSSLTGMYLNKGEEFDTGKYAVAYSTDKTTVWTVGKLADDATDIYLTIGDSKLYLNNNPDNAQKLQITKHDPIGTGNACSLWEMREHEDGYKVIESIGDNITDLNQLTDGSYVIFYNVGRQKYIYEGTHDHKLWMGTTPTTGAGHEYIFRVRKEGDKYAFMSVSSGRYFSSPLDGQDVFTCGIDNSAKDEFTITAHTEDNTKWLIKSSNINKWWDAQDARFVGWNGNGTNSRYEIKPVNVKNLEHDLAAFITTDENIIKWVNIKNVRSGKYATYEGESTKMTQKDDKSMSKAFFYMTGTLETATDATVRATVKIHNFATENLCAEYNSWTTAGTNWNIMASQGQDINPGWAISKGTDLDNGNAWNNEGGGGSTIAYWNGNDQGSTWAFVSADYHTLVSKLDGLKEELKSVVADAKTAYEDGNVTKVPVTLSATEGEDGYLYSNADGKDNSYAGDNLGVGALIDGQDGTFLHTNYQANSTDGLDHYIRVDMGENKTIDYFSFGYKGRQNGGANSPKTMIIEGSNDNDKYYEIATLTNLPNGNDAYASEPMGGKPYRYIRFMVTETQNGSIYEGHPYFALASFNLNKVTVKDGAAIKTLVYDNLSKSVAEAERVLASSKFTEDDINGMMGLLSTIIAGLEVKEYPFELTKNINDPVCYHIKSGRSKDWSSEGNFYWTFIDGKITTITADPNYKKDVEAYWFFTENPKTGQLQLVPFIEHTKPMGYTTVSDAADKITNNVSATGFVGTDYILVTNTTDAWKDYPYALKPYGGNTYVSNHGGKQQKYMGFYNGHTDGGTRFLIEEAEIVPSSKLRNLRDALAPCPDIPANQAGTAIGLYNAENHAIYTNIITNARAAYNDATLPESDYFTHLVALDNDLRTLLVMNTPEVGKFYRLQNVRSGKYMSGNGTTIKLTDDENASELMSTVFYLAENNVWLSFADGRYLDTGNRGYSAVGVANAGEFGFANGGPTENVITYKNNGSWTYGGADTSNSGTDGIDKASSAGNDGYNWTIKEVTWLPVPMNTTAGYATLYSPVALSTYDWESTTAHRVEAYVGKINNNVFSLERIDKEDGIIPANTPVVLKYVNGYDEAKKAVYLEIKESEKTCDLENDLEGTYADTYITEDAYVLSYVNVAEDGQPEEKKIGFYTATKNQQEGTSFLNNGFKAYLPKPAGSNSRFFLFDFGGNETGIESVESENGNANSEVYDLAGRRVQNAQKGIFIVNGKKVIK